MLPEASGPIHLSCGFPNTSIFWIFNATLCKRTWVSAEAYPHCCKLSVNISFFLYSELYLRIFITRSEVNATGIRSYRIDPNLIKHNMQKEFQKFWGEADKYIERQWPVKSNCTCYWQNHEDKKLYWKFPFLTMYLFLTEPSVDSPSEVSQWLRLCQAEARS